MLGKMLTWARAVCGVTRYVKGCALLQGLPSPQVMLRLTMPASCGGAWQRYTPLCSRVAGTSSFPNMMQTGLLELTSPSASRQVTKTCDCACPCHAYDQSE